MVIAGVIQIGLGLARAGFIAAFFPSSVIKGLLAAIGVILILKQIPHLLGHDADPEGEMAFLQPDQENTFSEFGEMLVDLHPGAAVDRPGCRSRCWSVWDRVKLLKKSVVPAPLVVVLLGVAMSLLFRQLGGSWAIERKPPGAGAGGRQLGRLLRAFCRCPTSRSGRTRRSTRPGLTIAAGGFARNAAEPGSGRQDRSASSAPRPPAASWSPKASATSPSGLLGGMPVTSVIVRSSVNINAGGQTKLSAIFHGVLLLVCVMLLPAWLNLIPLSCLAAILLVTGIKLASPKLVKQMWSEGRYQFIPFAVTVVAIVLTDLLVGIVIGLAVSIGFILNSNLRRPIRRFVEKHLGGDVLHIELANQVSFLNRAALDKVLDDVPRGGHVLLDAQNTDYIDPDVLDLIRDFKEQTAPARGVEVSLLGFRNKYQLEDQIQYVDYSTRELQSGDHPAAGAADSQRRQRAFPHRPATDARPRPAGQRHGAGPASAGGRAQLHRLAHAGRVDLRPGRGRYLQRAHGRQHRQPQGAGQHRIWLRRGRGEAGAGDGAHPLRRGDHRGHLCTLDSPRRGRDWLPAR